MRSSLANDEADIVAIIQAIIHNDDTNKNLIPELTGEEAENLLTLIHNVSTRK